MSEPEPEPKPEPDPFRAPPADIAHAGAPAPAPTPSPAPAADAPARPFIITFRSWIRDYFYAEPPTFGIAIVPMAFLSMLLFTRHPTKTNFIFDEQEALLANPYVRSVADAQPKFRWIDAFYRDFWGLPAERSIGSYRPIPNLIWRALWAIGARDQTPFLHHWINVLFHGINGAIAVVIAHKITRDKTTAWLTGALFTGCAVLTEAVTGVVGIADVFGGLGAILALAAVALPLRFLPFGVFLATLFGLYSKESAMVCVPMVPFAALATADILFPDRPRRWLRAFLALLGACGAFVLYVEARRRMFPAPLPAAFSVEALRDKGGVERAYGAIMRWYAQPVLPRDPLNNPLVNASADLRVAGGLRVYVRGLWQILFPWTLSGDYSAPQEPIPPRLLFPESVIGGALLVAPVVAAPILVFLGWRSVRRQKAASPVDLGEAGDGPYRDAAVVARPIVEADVRPAIAVALLWIIVSYFPVSNIPILLPTVRAERFWYFPAIGTSFLLALTAKAFLDEWRGERRRRIASVAVVTLFIVFQGICARWHANDYKDDLAFWDATRKAVPNSAKAHLNYSVMKGARGDLDARAASSRRALELAPEWPMASIYLGDTLCRQHKAAEAIPHYKKGFELAPGEVNLIALALQCLWEEKALVPDAPLRGELDKMGDARSGSWLDYLVKDILANGETHNGVDPKHRPRGYNEGPKD